jgi:hypothetical protein
MLKAYGPLAKRRGGLPDVITIDEAVEHQSDGGNGVITHPPLRGSGLADSILACGGTSLIT